AWSRRWAATSGDSPRPRRRCHDRVVDTRPPVGGTGVVSVGRIRRAPHRLSFPRQRRGLRRDGQARLSERRDIVVVGAGHNGLVAACYLAQAGLDVEVVERDTVIGGAVSTVERWPGVRVDRGSTMHVLVRHTGITEELA